MTQKAQLALKRRMMVAVLFVLSVFCSCREAAKPEAVQAKRPLRIGLVTWIGYGPLYIAKEKKFFEEQGIEVDLQRIEGDVERRAAIASGNLEGIALTLDSMIVLRARGIPLRTVLALDASNGGDGIVAVPAIRNVDELKGREIAFPTGLPSHLLLYTVLKSRNLRMSDIKPIIMDADQAGAAFASGKIDAAVTWEPWLSKATEIGRGHILATSKDYPETIEDVLFMREEVIVQRRKDVEGLIKAWYKAVAYVSSNPKESKEIMARAFGLPPERVDKLLAGLRYEGEQGNKNAFGTPEKPGFLFPMYDRISDAWVAERVIEKRDKPESGIEPALVRSVTQ